MLVRIGMRCAVMAALILGTASVASAADDGVWSVSRSSGEVWLATNGAQQVSLNQEETLKPGDTIRTGRNGRVLLVRGEETILISPNSVVGVPAEKKEGLSTTIVQQAGSILLEVEKRNVKHFEVETPYLAAVVKGTHFSVTVDAGSTKVGVLRGQVEVSDFKTGQIAQVMPGQVATAFEHGKPGLSLTGTGTLNPIEQGKPRASTIERVPVPKSGLPAPRDAANGHAIHALGTIDKGTKVAGASQLHQSAGVHAVKAGVVHISSSLGEVKLNFHKVTHGLAHNAVALGQVRSVSVSTDTVWSDSKSNATTTAANSTAVTAVSVSSSAATSSVISSASSVATTVATTAGSVGGTSGSGSSGSGATGNGNGGNGNSGNGNSGNGNSGNGNSGNGNSGNGNGNSGNNGNHYGWYKHH
ncbi:FecR domain-containing protein [Bradyrhizobium manausense]|uniref:FecR family protein n=1 Tax=Bradyrhizobium manausense TaxID=989370 RepID=UPI001BA683B6|nr:FecR family protein [Bradyrhizobium manausense]MBR1088614.1 FecR domain-containing protein [Bradyrhizobium manausense]